MNNILGGGSGQPVATQATRYNGMQVQASQYGMGLPIVYGTQRVAGTLIWYGDFQSIEHSQNVGKGGGGGTSTSYTYSSSFQLALCEGPVAGLGTIWKHSGTTTLSEINGTFSAGSATQAAWSHLSNPANLQYPNTAWVGCLNLALGSSPTVPNFNFEIQGLLRYAPTGSPAIIDADPSAIFSDLLTSTTHGLNFGSFLGSLTQYHNYCVANNLFLSLKVDQQTTMNEILTRLLQVTNSQAAWNDGQLTVIPYGDETVTGNGVTYTPATTVQKYFTDSDYVKPVQVTQKALGDLYNVIRVEYVNRSNNYNTSVAEAKDQADIDNTFGIRQQEMIQAHGITDATTAQWVAQQILQRALYIRNTYVFTTTMENVAYQPGDVIALSDSLADLTNEPVRIVSISEQGSNELQFTCEEFPAGVAVGATQSVEAPAGFVPNFNGAPDASQPPVIFRAPQFLTNGTPEVWLGVGGSGSNWGGANILVSRDNVTYRNIGSIAPGCRYGTLTSALATSASDPDTTNSYSVALDAGGTLSGGSHAEADALSTMMLIDSEVVAYSSTTLNGDGTYTLGNGYLRRGCYETTIAAHSIGAPWLRIVEGEFFRWQVDASDVGTTVYIKIQPWNLYGGGLVSEASLTPTTYVVGAAEEIPDTPPVPTNFTVTPAVNGNLITWDNTNPAAVKMTSVEYSPDGTTWTVLGQVQGTHYTHPFSGNTTYYYRARALGQSIATWSAYTSTQSAQGGSVDHAADGSVFARPRTGILRNGVLRQQPVGKNLAPNPSFELNNAAPGAVSTVGQIVVDGWYLGNFYWTGNAFQSTFHAYSGLNSVCINNLATSFAAGQTYDARLYTDVIPVRPGEKLYFGGYRFADSNISIPAGITVLTRLGVQILDGSRALVTEAYPNDLNNASPGWNYCEDTVTVPSNGAFVEIELCSFIINSTGSPITVAGVIGDAYFDDVFLFVQVGMDSEAFDGNTFLRMPAPPAVSAQATTSLSQSGTTTTINVGSSTFKLGNITLTASSGSVNPGAYGKYFVYFDDPGYVSGAQTYQATTDATQITANPFRFYVGTITTVSGGGGSGGGGGGGGGGCCLHETQAIELADGREIPASDLEVGMVLLSHEGPTKVTQLRKLPHREWYKINLNNGANLFVAGDHRFLDPDDNQLRAWDLKPRQMVKAREGLAFVTTIEVLWDDARKVAIEVEEPHTYYVQGILSHNKVLC